MADDFEDNRGQFQGDVIIPIPTATGIPRSCNVTSSASCSAGESKHPQRSGHYSTSPSTSGDLMSKGSPGNHNHNHNHHYHRHHHSKGKVKKHYNGSSDRFSRTAAVLRQAGLMKLTLQIAQLIKTNEDLQKEIDELQSEALQFSENLKMQLQQKLQDQNGTSDLHDENK